MIASMFKYILKWFNRIYYTDFNLNKYFNGKDFTESS